jgi:lipopolysaccharide transport system ATP-binding protein
MNVIRADNLSKLFYLGEKRSKSIRESIVNFARGHLSSASRNMLWALRDVSFEVRDGETLGIMGRNGAGKSTLLKILSRITRPTAGAAEIRGRIGSLLEVGTGFHNELSGRENIYLNGAILGMTHAEIDRKFDEIVAFSEVEEFLDTPVKHYSSGMYMRLAFSVAAHLEPEILIVDEVLAVGDSEFQKKCLGKMDEVSRSGRTVLFVSHNLGSLAQICQKGLLLHKGRIVSSGGIEETIDDYLSLGETDTQFKLEKLDPHKDMQFREVFITNGNGAGANQIQHDEDFFLEFKVHVKRINKGALYCVALLNKYKERVFSDVWPVEDLVPSAGGEVHIKYRIPGNFIAPNHYSFLVQVFLPTGGLVDDASDVCPFAIVDTGSQMAIFRDYGVVQANGEWSIVEE